MSGPTQAHLYVTQINSIRSHFIGTIELITCVEIFESRFEIEVLKIGSLKLKFEICDFFWNLKFRNYEFSKFKTRITES